MWASTTTSKWISLLVLSSSSLLLFVDAATNDSCQDATAVTSLPFTSQGDTSEATEDFFATPADMLRNLTCGITSMGRGVWYQISLAESSQFVKATVTTPEAAVTNFNLALFRGDSCQTMECMLPRDYLLDNQQNDLTWFAFAGETYLLHVTGLDVNATGPYELTISEVGDNFVKWRLRNDPLFDSCF